MAFLIFIGLLVALILVHELGHFAVAKFFKIRVDEFGIFFPPRLAGLKRGETEYTLNLLPLGGFVRIFGENAQEGKGDPRSFASKSRWVQAAVIVAGVVMNVLFAWLILSLGYMAGLPTSREHAGFGEVKNVHTTVLAVLPDSPAARSGVMPHDIVTAVATAREEQGAPLTAEAVSGFIASHQDESIVLGVLRDGEAKAFVMLPSDGLLEGRRVVGIQMDDVGTLTLPPHTAVLEGALLTYHATLATAQGLGGFFAGLVKGGANFSEVAGPIGIIGLGASAVRESFAAALVLTAIISINLAIINLLPIPGLDGGRLLIIALEGLLRRSIAPRITLALTIGGFVFLIGLMLLVSYFDVVRLIG